MDNPDFVVVGSSGGGATIAWLLAKANFRVVILELGDDWSTPLREGSERYNPIPHDEYLYRVARPELKRRPRGDYNTYRRNAMEKASPIAAAWTASMLGGGSVIWGVWSFRALPIDFRLATHFGKTGQLKQLNEAEGYSVVDWPVTYAEMEPYYNLAEALLAVCGKREEIIDSVTGSSWFQAFKGDNHFQPLDEWQPRCPFPNDSFPLTPVGAGAQKGMAELKWKPARLPSGVTFPKANPTPGDGYSTREAIRKALEYWPADRRPNFWRQAVERIWSDRLRDPCTMCGYCGEYLCWGKNGPKSGALGSTIAELRNMPNVEIVLNAKAFEVICDEKLGRTTGVRYLDLRNPDHAEVKTQPGGSVIVSCGAVQSARLLLMSSPRGSRINGNGQVGRYVTFHLFGLGSTYVLPPDFQGLLRGELGHTGNTMSFEPYFVSDGNKWWKGGTIVSSAKKNPMDNAIGSLVSRKKLWGKDLLAGMESYNRTLEIRLTGDDLPTERNRVDLDPFYVDEYGLPVARVTRDFGPAEKRMFDLTQPMMKKVWQPYLGLPRKSDPIASPGNLELIGDHQMGTCRMGDDSQTSVIDRFCRVHGVPNLYVVDSSFMPTGLGLNPMVSVVANALRVGSWIVQEAGKDAAVG